MKLSIIACENLKDEVNLILEDINIKPNIRWIESDLHNVPSKLNNRLQEEIDLIEDENILLLYGCCGNATIGLSSNKSKLVCPRVEDCISLYLGGNKKRASLIDANKTYFFTKSYMENELSLYNEIKQYKEKHGENKAKKVYKTILKHYKYIRTIDTKAYDLEDIVFKSEYLSREFDLEHEVVDGDLSILRKALTRDWDESFIGVDVGEKIELNDFL